MRWLLVATLKAALLGSCAAPTPTIVTPAPPLATPALDSSEPSMAWKAPADFRPPHRCESASLESAPYAVNPLRWTFYCDFDITDSASFRSLLRDAAVGQGWRQCGALLLFGKDDLVMAIEPVMTSPLRTRDPMRPSGGRPAAFALAQWIRTGDCR
jgi:hypothetical protein